MNCRMCQKPGHQDTDGSWWHDGPPVYHLFRPDIARRAVEASPDLPPALERCHRCKAWIAQDEESLVRNGYHYHTSVSLCDERLDEYEALGLSDPDMWTPERGDVS